MIVKSKILSLVVPTYNRSDYLAKQINWIVGEVDEIWSSIELIICDNASTDDTPDICEKWKKVLPDNRFKVFRNPENFGLIKNCLLGIERATGTFVWLVGDDDPIYDGAIKRVVNIIANHPDLNAIHLNHRCVSGPTGEVLIPKFYSINRDIYEVNKGADAVSSMLQSQHTGGFMFITANVINRYKALEFIKNSSQEESSFLAYPMLLNAGLASSGPFYFVHECLLDCVYDQSSWSDRFEKVHYQEVPRMLLTLGSMGVAKKALTYCLNFQFKDILSVRDILYKLRNQKGYTSNPEFKQWLRRWKSKETIKWKMLFQ